MSRKDAPVKQVKKRFNPDEIRTTKISSRLNKCKKGLTGQATAQRKTLLYFDLILNRKDARGAKVFLIALRAGYLLRLFTTP